MTTLRRENGRRLSTGKAYATYSPSPADIRRWHTRPIRLLLLGLTFVGLLWPGTARSAEPHDAHWGFSTDLGLWTGTTNNTTVALRFGLGYYMDPNFSFGGMALFTPIGDLTQVGVAGVAKYHLRLSNGFNLVPFAGLGILHADLNRGNGPTKGRSQRHQLFHSTGHVTGVSDGTENRLLNDSHGEPPSHHALPTLPNDNSSVSLLVGIRWGP